MLQIFNYNAGAGDCIRLRFQGYNVVIDTGVVRFGFRFGEICNEIEKGGEKIDLLILTHADADHIGGVLYNLRLTNKLPVQQVWMNHGYGGQKRADLSVRQNEEVYSRFLYAKIPVLPATAGMEHKLGEAYFRILAPDKRNLYRFGNLKQRQCMLRSRSDYRIPMKELMEKPIRRKDTSLNNRVSIVFEFLFEKIRILFTGDAYCGDITDYSDGNYDIIKLPHHGVVRNISEKWKNVKCDNYIICTDGVHHPDKQTIAKLCKWNPNAVFYGSNNWWGKILREDEKGYEKHFREGEEYGWSIRKID